MSGNNIKVVCRFRPQNKLEIREGGVPIIDIADEGSSLKFNVSVYLYYLLWHKIHLYLCRAKNTMETFHLTRFMA